MLDLHAVWVLICAILVLFMSIPGIALFYGGLVQQKNVLSVYVQCIAMAAVASLLWLFIGYFLVFGHLGSILFSFHFHGWRQGLSADLHQFFIADGFHMHKLPNMFYQLGFSVIAVVIIIGGFAERMRFSVSLLFSALWLLIVYCPIAHAIWGGGWLDQLGVMDYAGGAVVHINAGVAGLVAAIALGRRRHLEQQISPHSMSLVTIGVGILWVGWFGFNGGSATAHGGLEMVSRALLNTQLAPCSAALIWLLIDWLAIRKPRLSGALMGAVAGLVAITPMAGYCSFFAATITGAIAACACYAISNLKYFFQYDDALDAFGIHGAAGIVGAILTGIFGAKVLGGVGLHGHSIWYQLYLQLFATVMVILWSGVWTAIILWVISRFKPLRVPRVIEEAGLDYHVHGENSQYVEWWR